MTLWRLVPVSYLSPFVGGFLTVRVLADLVCLSLLDMRPGGTPRERVFAAEVLGLRSVWEQSPFTDPLSTERSGSGQGARKAPATRRQDRQERE